MNIKLNNFEVEGRFKVIKLDEHGNENFNSGWQKNLVTNSGLDSLGLNNNSMSYLHLSSNNVPPEITDTTVIGQERVAGGGKSSFNYAYVPDVEYFTEATYLYTFAPETVERAYNVSKVHLSSSSDVTNIFSAALIRDSEGNAVTLSIRGKETLLVYYSLRNYFPVGETTSSLVVEIDRGTTENEFKTYTVKTGITAKGFLNYNGTGWNNVLPYSRSDFRRYQAWNQTTIYADMNWGFSENIITSHDKYTHPSVYMRTTKDDEPYVPGTYTKRTTMTFTRDLANFTDGIRAFVISTTRGVFYVNITNDIDGKGIPKTSFDELEMTVSMSWGRRE